MIKVDMLLDMRAKILIEKKIFTIKNMNIVK